MSRRIAASLFLVLSAVSCTGHAGADAVAPAGMRDRPASPTTVLPDHTMSGVIESFDVTSLVIARPGKNPAEMVFVLRPSTQRQGGIVVGATVQVRYRAQGGRRVATALVAPPVGISPIHDIRAGRHR